MKRFKVKYATRLLLQKAIQMQIQRLGLVDTYGMKDSIRISAAAGDLNKISFTVNAVFYYMFQDQGADLWNGGVIVPQKVTEKALKSPLGLKFQKQVMNEYVAWLTDNYPILEVGRIIPKSIRIEWDYNLFGDESGSWNGQFFSSSKVWASPKAFL